jgi:hypothetical protein
MEDAGKRILEARACNSKGSLSWIIPLDKVESTVKEFQAVHPSVKHTVGPDWDDDTLYRIRFSWEPGKFGVVTPLKK